MIKKIAVEHLEPGMFVVDMNVPWFRHPFLRGRRHIRNARDIDRIRRYGITHVYIDTERGRDSPHAVPAQEARGETEKGLLREVSRPATRPVGSRPAQPPPERAEPPGKEVPAPPPPDPFDRELARAREIYAEARRTVEEIFASVRAGAQIDVRRVKAVVQDMIGSIFRNRDALLSLARIKDYDAYTYQHSLNVATLALNLGVAVGVLEDELFRMGVGALLHDIGKTRIPDSIVRKPGRLTDEEFRVVRQHTVLGAQLLLAHRGVPEDSVAAALNHHERFDGSGYPRGLSGHGIGKFGLLCAVCDVYDAMTTTRPYQQAFSPAATLRRLYEWSGRFFHPVYVQKFIQCVGVYPAGTVVRLDTGETGVVVRQNRDDLVRPWVRVVTTPRGHPLPTPVDVDLRQPDPHGEKAHARSVASVVPPAKVRIDVDAVLALPANPEHEAPRTVTVH